MPSDAANGNSLAPAPPASGANAAQPASADDTSSSAFWVDLDRRLKVRENIVLRKAS